MKKVIYFMVILLSHNVAAQFLIKPDNSRNLSNKTIEILNSRLAVVDYQPIKVNLDELNEDTNILSFFDITMRVRQQELEVRGFKNFSWFGKGDNILNSVILSVKGEDIQGIITFQTRTFRIETIEGQYFLTEINQNEYPREACFLENVDKTNMGLNRRESNTFNSPKSNYKISGEPFTCRLRILVLYTPAAREAASDIENTIQLSVNTMNNSFLYSSVNYQVELVYSAETDYTESNLPYTNTATDHDLFRFTNNNDGYMDEVHNLRIKHQADICVLISADDAICGIAKGLKVSSTYAFCIVNWDCAVSNYSFAHEIGHLIGCDHDFENSYVEQEDLDYPYSYPFGFINENNFWRTIMAYPCGAGCNRVPFWSNPNVTINGHPTGIEDECDNARMLNEKIPNAMSLFQPENNVFVENIDVSEANEGDIIAKNKIENIGNNYLIIYPFKSYSFRAGKEIIFKPPGFIAASGSDFVAEIVSVENCGQSDGQPSDYGVIPLDKKRGMSIDKTIMFDFALSPNPVSNNLKISIEPKAGLNINLNMKLISFTGTILQNVDNIIIKSNGKYEYIYDISNLDKGIYFLAFFKDNQMIYNHKIIKQ